MVLHKPRLVLDWRPQELLEKLLWGRTRQHLLSLPGTDRESWRCRELRWDLVEHYLDKPDGSSRGL